MGPQFSAVKPAFEYRTQVLDRVFSILDVLAEDGPELGISDLTSRLRLHKSTVHRLLVVLARNRYVEKRPLTGKYRLGSRLFELGMSAVAKLDLLETARPHLERLVVETGETAHLGVLRQGEIISILNAQSDRSLRTPSTVGRRSPAHCGSQGKAILAWLPENELDGVIKTQGLKTYTRNTITSASALKRELEGVRERGFAIDNEEFEEGLKCIGAAVRDHSDDVVAAISIAGPAFRLTEDRMPALTGSVLKAAAQLSAALGYREPKLETRSSKLEVRAPADAGGPVAGAQHPFSDGKEDL